MFARVLLLLLAVSAHSRLCSWVYDPSICQPGTVLRYYTDPVSSISEWQSQCRVLWKRDITIVAGTGTSGYCTAYGTSTTNILTIDQSVAFGGDTTYVSISDSTGSWSPLFDNWKFGFDLVVLVFILSLPFGIVMKILRGTPLG